MNEFAINGLAGIKSRVSSSFIVYSCNRDIVSRERVAFVPLPSEFRVLSVTSYRFVIAMIDDDEFFYTSYEKYGI